jgi:V-type H+-transporting ATPase subunit F
MYKQKIKPREEGAILAIIGDEDTVTGFLLAGIGNIDSNRQKNYLVVDSKTRQQEIIDAFKKFTSNDDIVVLLITQNIADTIRFLLDDYEQLLPTILEIPSKDHPYDPQKDYIMNRIKKLLGQD